MGGRKAANYASHLPALPTVFRCGTNQPDKLRRWRASRPGGKGPKTFAYAFPISTLHAPQDSLVPCEHTMRARAA